MSPSPHPSTGPFNSVFKIDLRSAHVSLSPLSPLYSNGLSLLDQCNSFISEWSSFHLPPTHSPSNGECDHIKIKTGKVKKNFSVSLSDHYLNPGKLELLFFAMSTYFKKHSKDKNLILLNIPFPHVAW